MRQAYDYWQDQPDSYRVAERCLRSTSDSDRHERHSPRPRGSTGRADFCHQQWCARNRAVLKHRTGPQPLLSVCQAAAPCVGSAPFRDPGSGPLALTSAFRYGHASRSPEPISGSHPNQHTAVQLVPGGPGLPETRAAVLTLVRLFGHRCNARACPVTRPGADAAAAPVTRNRPGSQTRVPFRPDMT